VTGALVVLAAGLLCAAVVPAFWRARTARRSAEVVSRDLRRDLPDALELLAAAIDGGAPVDRALLAVAAHVGEPLAGELRRAADPHAAARPGTMLARRPALRSLGALVASSEELGVPLASALRGLAAHERERRRREIRLRAAAAGPRMTLVVAGLLAPAALLLVVGAELLAVVRTVRGMP
jgi:Flp pilus assembly protein TadB